MQKNFVEMMDNSENGCFIEPVFSSDIKPSPYSEACNCNECSCGEPCTFAQADGHNAAVTNGSGRN